jgi:hypothetical protein
MVNSTFGVFVVRVTGHSFDVGEMVRLKQTGLWLYTDGICGGRRFFGKPDKEYRWVQIRTNCLEGGIEVHLYADAKVSLVAPHELVDRVCHGRWNRSLVGAYSRT